MIILMMIMIGKAGRKRGLEVRLIAVPRKRGGGVNTQKGSIGNMRAGFVECRQTMIRRAAKMNGGVINIASMATSMGPGEVIEVRLDVVSKNKQGHSGLHYNSTSL